MALSQIKKKFVTTIARAALETLNVQCNFPAKAGKPYAKGSQVEKKFEIKGFIKIKSQQFSGSISIFFPEKTFLSIISGMLGETIETINKDIEDGAGELLNIIFGQAKKSFAAQGYPVEPSVPKVSRANQCEQETEGQLPAIVIPFTANEDAFWIEFVLN